MPVGPAPLYVTPGWLLWAPEPTWAARVAGGPSGRHWTASGGFWCWKRTKNSVSRPYFLGYSRRRVDDNEVGRDGGQEEADGQEGGQGVQKVVEPVISSPVHVFTDVYCTVYIYYVRTTCPTIEPLTGPEAPSTTKWTFKLQRKSIHKHILTLIATVLRTRNSKY